MKFYKTPLLMYHHIDYTAAQNKMSVSPETLRKQLRCLKCWGIDVVTVPEAYMNTHRQSGVRRCVSLTFDDGFHDNYEFAYPVLKEEGVIGTFFVSINRIGSPNYMTWEQIREMANAGMIIGSHAMTHRPLGDVPPHEWRAEVYDSKKILEEKLGVPITVFCYPVGSVNEALVEEVKKAGYEYACATVPPQPFTGDEQFTVRRIKVTETQKNPFFFWLKVCGFYTLAK